MLQSTTPNRKEGTADVGKWSYKSNLSLESNKLDLKKVTTTTTQLDY